MRIWWSAFEPTTTSADHMLADRLATGIIDAPSATSYTSLTVKIQASIETCAITIRPPASIAELEFYGTVGNLLSNHQ